MDRTDTERGHGLNVISVVIPIFNEEQNIAPLYRELKTVLGGIGTGYESNSFNFAKTLGRQLPLLPELSMRWVRLLSPWMVMGRTIPETSPDF
jgi:hypothetical protein